MTHKSRLNGKRGVPLLRCSTMTQADTSIDDQLNSIETFAKRMDMQLGEPVRLAGKSGSIKKNLDGMVDQVITRKHAGERIGVWRGRTITVRVGLELALIRQSEAVRIASDDFGSSDASDG